MRGSSTAHRGHHGAGVLAHHGDAFGVTSWRAASQVECAQGVVGLHAHQGFAHQEGALRTW